MNLTEQELITLKSALYSYEVEVRTWIPIAQADTLEKIKWLHVEIDQELKDITFDEQQETPYGRMMHNGAD